MSRFKQYITVGCISFTFSILFYLSFRFLDIFPSMDEVLIIKMLFISFGITCLIFLTHLLPIHNTLILRSIEMLDVIIVLLVAGAFFNLFPFNKYYILFSAGIGIMTYIVVVLVTFAGNQTSAMQINDAIARKKGVG